MSRIRGRGNRDTELALRGLFRRHGIVGWRRHLEIRTPNSELRNFKVKPDFVFPQLKLAVFVDGCFWHGCPKHCNQPANNRAFWRRKLAANRARDRLVTRTLRRRGWRVLRIWEHELARTKAKKRSTPHPGPLPDRGREGEARLVRRIERFLA